jgi:hypothetical protein
MLKALIPLAIAVALPATANAGSVGEDRITLAAGACQSALPVFDGVVRKRPLAVQNEGDSVTFITCALEGRFGAAESSDLVGAILVNTSDAPATVNCTLVDGRNNLADPVYMPKSVMLAANEDIDVVWSVADNEGANFIYPAMSCALPPGVGIKAVAQQFLGVL